MSALRRRGPEPFDEAVAATRTNVLHAAADLRVPVLLATGPGRRVGRTRICAELAVSLARAGHRVVAVDMDLRHSDLASTLGAPAGPGVWDVLAGRAEPGDCIQWLGRWPALGLLPAGHPGAAHADGAHPNGTTTTGDPSAPTSDAGGSPGQAADALAGPAVGPLLEDLAGRADLVLVDTPPLPDLADALAVAHHAGGAVLVLDGRRTRLAAAEAARAALERAGLAVIGAVVNRPPR